MGQSSSKMWLSHQGSCSLSSVTSCSLFPELAMQPHSEISHTSILLSYNLKHVSTLLQDVSAPVLLRQKNSTEEEEELKQEVGASLATVKAI